MNAIEFFRHEALNTVPRVLGLCDREAASATFGCADRAYWHYRTIDFPNARLQEAGLLLAQAFKADVPDNPFFAQRRVLQWVLGIWRFWLERRNRDGSVAEVYPRERSFCATAFSAAALVETAFVLRDDADWTPTLDALAPTLHWLARNTNHEVANQMAASYLALRGYHALRGDPQIGRAADARKQALLSLADGAGMFSEYGGHDSGYQTITMSALATALSLYGPDDEIAGVLGVARDTMTAAFREGPPPPAENSRNTQFAYPYAFAGMADFLEEVLFPLVADGRVLRPSWMDDRYCIALATDYLRVVVSRYRGDASCG